MQPDRAVRRDPAGRAGDGRRGRRRVLPGPRRHAARGVRAPRPQGPLRQGTPRRDPRLHRDLLALRGARRTPTCGSTPPGAPSRTAATRCCGALAERGFVTSRRGRRGRRVDAPIRVLFVCTANICRSPYLELRARQLLGPDSGVEVSSAGTRGFDDSGQRHMEAEFARWGTETDGFRSRPATGELLDEADLVLTAEAAHRTQLLELRPAAFRKIFTVGQFVETAQARPRCRARPDRARSSGVGRRRPPPTTSPTPTGVAPRRPDGSRHHGRDARGRGGPAAPAGDWT